VTQAVELLEGWETTRVIADKGYDAQSVLDHVATMGAEAVIPPKSNRKEQRDFDKEFYKERHLAECFFNKVKQFRRRPKPVRCCFGAKKVFSRFDQLGRNYLAFVQFASVMIWLR
jgi:transposase